jgi:glycine/D-amino acid oxidase-like deaminating enzyme
VDVAVVGAGFTGLGAALALRADGLSVAVIEREFAGFGASGRNAGHLTPTIGKDLPTLLRMYGRERTRSWVDLAETAIAQVEDFIDRYGIDCDYRPVGNVLAAVDASQERRLERAAAAAESLGLATRHLDSEAMRKRGLPEAFRSGVLEEVGGVLDPGKYVRALRRAVIDAGAELYEATPLTRLEQGATVRLETPRGALRAGRVLLATNAYARELGIPFGGVLPTLVSLFRTAPLTPAQRDRIDWRGGEGIYTAHELLESYRLTADGRILGGSKYVRYGLFRRPLPARDPATYRRLEGVFRERFPGLDAPIEDFWSGPIALTLDFLPVLGRTGRHRNIFYALGYGGHGIAMASYAGQVFADWIAGRQGPGALLAGRRRLPLPPDPLGWLLARTIDGALRVRDHRVDRRLRRR